ncbi:MAG: hypothetical protein LBL56_01315 [Treponema sp.]|jgi:hypothetical protein|nr:hypothetical protein [Treponema sp.]
MQESAKNAKKSENAGEKLAFSTLDLTRKSLSKRLWCLAPFWGVCGISASIPCAGESLRLSPFKNGIHAIFEL